MKLFIVESPTKVKIIQKYLSDDYKVIGTKGHLFNLKNEFGKNYLGIDLDKFEPMMTVIKQRASDLKKIKSEFDKANEIIFATDNDREGEAISYYLAEYLGIDVKKTKRVVYNEISQKKILQAIKDIRNIDVSLVNSQKARRMIDRIIGFMISSELRKTIRSRSAGRVQSVVLKLISDKEKRINDFVPENHFKISIKLKNGLEIEYYSTKLVLNKEKESVQKVIDNIDKIKLNKVTEKIIQKKPSRPLITSRLLAQCYDKYSFSAQKTSLISQHLYEGINKKNKPLITYIRTDSTRVSNDFLNSAKIHFKSNGLSQYYNDKYFNGIVNNSKKNKIQDAHEAIRPINLQETPDKAKLYLSSDDYKVYKLIYYHTLAAFSKNLQTKTTTYWWQENDCRFTWKKTDVLFLGYSFFTKKIMDSKNIPSKDVELKKDTLYDISKIVYKKDETKPEGRYSEASIIRDLEKIGIGRPSTYSKIIFRLKQHNYIGSEKRSLQPTVRGMYTNNVLQKHFFDIFNEQYTSKMEESLDKVANAELDYKDLTKNTYDKICDSLVNVKGKIEVISGIPLKDKKCPKCNNDLLIKWSQKVKNDFIGCSNYPDCKHIETLSGFKSQPIGKKCEKCQSDFVTRKGRRNSVFVACSGFPKCRNILKLKPDELKNIIEKLKKDEDS